MNNLTVGFIFSNSHQLNINVDGFEIDSQTLMGCFDPSGNDRGSFWEIINVDGFSFSFDSKEVVSLDENGSTLVFDMDTEEMVNVTILTMEGKPWCGKL